MGSRKRFLGVASAFELALANPSSYGSMIDAASQLRTVLMNESMSLTPTDKVRVLRSVTKARVKVLMGSASDGCDAFKTLDAIGTDIVRLL